ncbi:FKBP-type peptidyl-prolyl cis-trans isomerase [bacterium]|nr:MAG: FKBP-type peptidyl-prolyl cis-trans isomerase [bacterium]
MDKSKLIAIAVLVIGIGCIALFKEKPPTPEGEHSDEPAAQSTPDFDVVGGITKLQVVDERKGTGTIAKKGDMVAVNYRGTLLNGKMFDQSYGKAPFIFPLGAGKVIKGWDEGVAGMRVGGKRKLTIPASLGYGDKGAGADIPPNATLKFDVELMKVNGKG